VGVDEGGSEGFFGERAASFYDERSAAMSAPEVVGPVVRMLADLAGDGDALEFGIGTGRIALPLAERGVRVAGIDNSEAMLARLRAKPGAEDIEVALGDFSSARVGGQFSVVYLVFNTISNLVTQDAQVACFQNAAAHLRSGGRFVIENGVPALQSLPPGQTVLPFRADPEGFSFDVYKLQARPVEFRYAWPAELDLMARLAGMRLRDRWAGWEREPFTAVSPAHISVYEKP
jgi:SAM-dependent methyltransferase